MGLSYKFLLDKRRKKADCIYSLKLRIYEPSGNKEMSLEIQLHENDWDEDLQRILSSDSNFEANDYKLNVFKAKIARKLLLAEDDENELNAEGLLESLKKKKVEPVSKTVFKSYSNILVNGLLKAGKAGTALAYQDATNSIISYAGDEKLTLDAINYKFLEGYNTSMLARKVKVNTIACYLRSIRAIYNKAIKSDLISKDKYPFTSFKIDTEDTPSRKLLIDELKLIISYPLKEHTPIWHNRNYFLLSFCLIGINFADMFTLENSDIRDSVVSYKRNKTGRLYKFALHPYAINILSYYKGVKSNNREQYILPNLEFGLDSLSEKKRIKQICKNCSKYMKTIAKNCHIHKPISTYYARYSWANIAKKLGYSNDMIAEALGHEYGNSVTNIYLDNYDDEVISEMNQKVLERVFGD